MSTGRAGRTGGRPCGGTPIRGRAELPGSARSAPARTVPPVEWSVARIRVRWSRPGRNRRADGRISGIGGDGNSARHGRTHQLAGPLLGEYAGQGESFENQPVQGEEQ